jgi:hypothetical protein
MYISYPCSVPKPQRKHSAILLEKPSGLILFGEMMAACCRLYTKHITRLEAVKVGAREEGDICDKEEKAACMFY